MLVEKNFSDYETMAEEVNALLSGAGYEITVSRSGLHRYGRDFEEKLAAIKVATEQARAITEAVGDDEGRMSDALINLVQQQAFDVLVNLKNEDPETYANLFPKMGVMVSRLTRASVAQKKWMAEARKKAISEAADTVEATAKKEGVSPETIKKIRRDVLMMAT